MSLEIRHTYAKIGIETTPSSLEIQSRAARLELHQEQARLNIHTELPRVEIDQYECFATAGLKGNLDRAREISARAYEGVLEFIGKTAEDGKTLAAIENKGNPIPLMAKRDAWPTHEFVLDFIPKARPKITIRGEVEIEPEINSQGFTNGVAGNYIPGSISMAYTPAEVRVYLLQNPSLKINYTGENVDLYL